MVKRLNKLMITLSLLGVGVIGVNSAETLATNVNAYTTSSTIYLSVEWDYWDDSNDFPERLMVRKDGGMFSDDFGVLLNNKTAIYGSKEVYINLKGSYNLSFTDHHNKLYHNYVFGNIYVDALILDDYYITFLLNGEYLGHLYVNQIQAELNDSESFYIIRNNRPSDYQLGFDDGLRVGYDDGFDDGYDDGLQVGYDDGYDEGLQLGFDDGLQDGYELGREDYGIKIGDDWKTADWWGSYQYAQGLHKQDATGFVDLLGAVFGGFGDLLGIEILPGIYIGAIIAVPLVFGIIFFILGKRKGD